MSDKRNRRAETDAVIRFMHNGAEYAMTEAEIEAAYRYKTHLNRLSDAEMQVKIFVYGYDAPEYDSENEVANRLYFEEEYGISYETAVSRPMLEKYVRRFDARYTCDYDENSQWEAAIRAALEDSV